MKKRIVIPMIIGVSLLGISIVYISKTLPKTEEIQKTEIVEEVEETEPSIEEEPSTEYELTEYEENHIRYNLRLLEVGYITEDDLTELYEEYGDKVDEIKEKVQKEEEEEEAKRQAEEEARRQAEEEARRKAEEEYPLIVYSCDESLNSSLQSYIDRVPNGVLDAIQSIGYRIELVENPAEVAGYNGKICGVTMVMDRRILIEANESKFRRSVVHEISHAFDDYLGFVSCSDEFYEIYEAEKESFVVTGFTTDGHYKTNVKEYFAEACQMFVYDSGTLQSSAPRTYDFVNRYINGV